MIPILNQIFSEQPKIEPRSDVSLGIGVLASNLLLSLSNALSLVLGFIFRKKVEVLISLAAILGPVLYLNMGSQPNNTVQHVHHHSDLGPDHHHLKEGRFVGSLISSLFSTVAWPFEYLLMPLEYILSFVVSPSSLPPVPAVTRNDTEQVKAPLPTLPPHPTSQDSDETADPALTLEALKQMLDVGVAEYFRKHEEEITLIRSSLLGPVTGIDLETVEMVDKKFGAGAWDSALSSFIEGQAGSQPQPQLLYQELHSVLGEFVSELVSIKRDVWSNVQQFDHLQREILDVKISALHGAVQTASQTQERKGRSSTESEDLVREIFEFLDSSSITPEKDSAAGKVAELWNIGLQLHDLLEEILQLGVSTVLQDSLTSKQVLEVSLLEKSGQVAALVLGLSDLALQVEEVRAAELAALHSSLQEGTVGVINHIATLTLNKEPSSPDPHHPVTVPSNTNNKVEEKETPVKVEEKETPVKVPDPAHIQDSVVESIDNSQVKLSNFSEQLDDQQTKIESFESLPEDVSNNLKAEIQELFNSGIEAEEVFGELFEEKETSNHKENSSSHSKLPEFLSDTSSSLVELLDQSPIPAQLSGVVKDIIKSSDESQKADMESLAIILFSSPLTLDPVKTELIDSQLGPGAWSSILSSLSLQQTPSFRNSLSGNTKLIAEILNESIGKVLRELASLSHDISDLMSEMNNLQTKITDTKLMAIVEAVMSKTEHQSSIFKIPGVVGDQVKTKFSEDVQKFLTPTGINIDTLKVTLFNFAFEMNQLKLKVVDSAITSIIESSSDLSALRSQSKSDLTNIVKQETQSTETEIEFLVMSLFDLTIQIDEAKRDEYLHEDSAGLNVVLDKINAFNEISVWISSGVTDEDSITMIKTIFNNRLMKHSKPLEDTEVLDLFKWTNISDEKQDEHNSNSVYSDLLGLHQG